MAEFWHFFVLVLSIAVLVLVENRKRGHCGIAKGDIVLYLISRMSPFSFP